MNTVINNGDVTVDQLNALFAKQKEAFLQRKAPISYKERIAALDKMYDAIYSRRMEMCAALDDDFGGRSSQETLLMEIFVMLDEIRHTKRHLKKWMKDERVGVNWQFLPARAKVVYQPVGVVGVIGAWNYQLLLSMSPVIGAISAGNHVMLKPARQAPKAAKLMEDLYRDIYPEEFVTVVNGPSEVSRAFSALPFDHIIFTGSTNVGKTIMRNASEHLTPVTLELGGKSPAIVSDNFKLDSAARRIAHGKFVNAGQTCVAPDYVMVRADQHDEFVKHFEDTIAAYYPTLVDNTDYTRIITAKEYQRLQNWLDEAQEKGATIIQVNPANEDCNVENKVFPPTIVLNAPDDCKVMQEELFGPIMPVVRYKELDDAIEYVKRRPHPLALYYFDNTKSRVQQMLHGTLSGGVTINGCIYHLPQHNMPFGGVGPSGMGAYHGYDGFLTFSKKKAVLMQGPFAGTFLMRPPYGKLLSWVIGVLLTNRLRKENL